MADNTIADLFNIKNRFLRSVNLERDFQDPTVLSTYVVTDFTKTCLDRVLSAGVCKGQPSQLAAEAGMILASVSL